MVRAIAAALLLTGCTVTATFDHHGRVTEVSLSPGLARAEAPAEGRQKISGLGVAYTGEAAVLGYFSVDTARLGPCGLVIITDHPERVDPALIKPC